MARVVAVFDDLLLGSNVLGMLRAAGYEAELVGAAQAEAAAGADVVILDLAGQGVEVVERLRAQLGGAKLLGVYSHVHVEQRAAAEAAGFDLVVPRSRMAREGAALVERLISPG